MGANKENLRSFKEVDHDELQQISSKAGKASGVKRRKNKRLRELVQVALEYVDADTGMTMEEKAVTELVVKAAAGDLKAFEMVMQLAGEWNVAELGWGDW